MWRQFGISNHSVLFERSNRGVSKKVNNSTNRLKKTLFYIHQENVPTSWTMVAESAYLFTASQNQSPVQTCPVRADLETFLVLTDVSRIPLPFDADSTLKEICKDGEQSFSCLLQMYRNKSGISISPSFLAPSLLHVTVLKIKETFSWNTFHQVGLFWLANLWNPWRFQQPCLKAKSLGT